MITRNAFKMDDCPNYAIQPIRCAICNVALDLIKLKSIVRFEVFAAVTMKNAVFCDVASCRYFVNPRFGGTYRLHLLLKMEAIRR
jgi:hypothetical protein